MKKKADQKAPFKDNALLLKTDGSIDLHTVDSLSEIGSLVGCKYPEMTFFGRYPITTTMGFEESLIKFCSFAIFLGKQQPPQKEYQFHIIDELEKIQMYVHESGEIVGLPPNPFFSGALKGDVIVLGHCIDETRY